MASEPVNVQHPDSEGNVTTELLTADKQSSQRQNEPLDPFMPSASALPHFMLQHTNLDDAASFSQSGESLSLLDADMPQANQMLSGNQPTRDLSAAMPYAATTAAAAAAVDEAHPRSAQVSTDVREATPIGLGILSVDSDAQDIPLTTPDLRSSASGSLNQPLAISSDTVSDDEQLEGVDHTADDNHQSQLQQTCLPESPESGGSLRKSATGIVAAGEAVTTGVGTRPHTSLVPPAPQSHSTPGLSSAASEMQDQQAIPTASGADFVSTPLSSAKDQQQQPQPGSNHERDAQVEILKHEAVLKPYEAAMAQAEQAERRLLTGDTAASLWCRHTQIQCWYNTAQRLLRRLGFDFQY